MRRNPIFDLNIDWKPEPKPVGLTVLEPPISAILDFIPAPVLEITGEAALTIFETDDAQPLYLVFLDKSRMKISFPYHPLETSESPVEEASLFGSIVIEPGTLIHLFHARVPKTVTLRPNSEQREMFRVTAATINSYIEGGLMSSPDTLAWQSFRRPSTP